MQWQHVRVGAGSTSWWELAARKDALSCRASRCERVTYSHLIGSMYGLLGMLLTFGLGKRCQSSTSRCGAPHSKGGCMAICPSTELALNAIPCIRGTILQKTVPSDYRSSHDCIFGVSSRGYIDSALFMYGLVQIYVWMVHNGAVAAVAGII